MILVQRRKESLDQMIVNLSNRNSPWLCLGSGLFDKRKKLE